MHENIKSNAFEYILVCIFMYSVAFFTCHSPPFIKKFKMKTNSIICIVACYFELEARHDLHKSKWKCRKCLTLFHGNSSRRTKPFQFLEFHLTVLTLCMYSHKLCIMFVLHLGQIKHQIKPNTYNIFEINEKIICKVCYQIFIPSIQYFVQYY